MRFWKWCCSLIWLMSCMNLLVKPCWKSVPQSYKSTFQFFCRKCSGQTSLWTLKTWIWLRNIQKTRRRWCSPIILKYVNHFSLWLSRLSLSTPRMKCCMRCISKLTWRWIWCHSCTRLQKLICWGINSEFALIESSCHARVQMRSNVWLNCC